MSQEMADAIQRRREWMAYQMIVGHAKKVSTINRIKRFIRSLF